MASEVLFAGYKEGREIGKARLGAKCLYFRDKLKVYYIPYEDMTRVFRRVVLIPAMLCCGKGDFEVRTSSSAPPRAKRPRSSCPASAPARSCWRS